ncbi:hypothetical protein [Parasphingorhabdus sp.]|uniref:hypothetical protein n=1 Tax=Parasphingorhabdus sp. TaxID=2709688 RepID=UPI003263AB3F
MEKITEAEAQAKVKEIDKDHRVTGPVSGLKPKLRRASDGTENRKPPTILARKPDAGNADSGIARGQYP